MAAAVYLISYNQNQSGKSQIPTGLLPNANATENAEQAKITIIALNDKRCGKDCNMTLLLSRLQKIFPAAIITELDYGSREGLRVYYDAGLRTLPAILFDKEVAQTKAYPSMAQFLDKSGQYLSLRIGGNWDPYCDPTTEHCSETKCANRINCRQEIPGKLDIYYMSYCPYGVEALNSMGEVLDAFKGEINFTVNIIAQEMSPGVFGSLHGDKEVAEDLRQICASKLYPEGYNYMEYVWCRNRNVTNTRWEPCATENGMDAEKINACAVGEDGKRLLSDNLNASADLGIHTSPTFLINNKKTFNAVTPAQIKDGICGTNPSLGGCNRTLSNQTKSAGQGGCSG